MELTRKQLNQILLNLPHPRLVEEGRISETYQVPVYNMDHLITDDMPSQLETKIRTLVFRYSYKEMDWVLQLK